MPREDESTDMFARMAAEGHAAFALASASNGVELASDRERDLVTTAIAAGVVGALEVIRQDDDPIENDREDKP